MHAWNSMMHQSPYIYLWYWPRGWPFIGKGWYELQARWGCRQLELCSTAFTSKSLSSTEWQYSNIEKRCPWHIACQEKSQHYCFCWGSKGKNRPKTIGSNVQQHVATLSQQLQCKMLCIHQCNWCIYLQAWTRPVYSKLAIPSQTHQE